MEQQKLNKNKSTDEKVNEILLRGIDEQLQILVNRKDSLENQIKEVDLQLEQLNFQRKNLIKDGWRKI